MPPEAEAGTSEQEMDAMTAIANGSENPSDTLPPEPGAETTASAEGEAAPTLAGEPPAGEPSTAEPMAAGGAEEGYASESASSEETAAAPPFQGSGEFESYTVQGGDTLMKIAFEYYGDLYQWRNIFSANQDKVQDPNNLPRGVVLKIEKSASPVSIDRNGEKWLIRSGDTLGKISGEVYGTQGKWKKLWENNRQLIRDPNKIFAGFYLYYTQTPEEKEEADRMRGLQPAPPMAGGGDPAGAPAAGAGSSLPAMGGGDAGAGMSPQVPSSDALAPLDGGTEQARDPAAAPPSGG